MSLAQFIIEKAPYLGAIFHAAPVPICVIEMPSHTYIAANEEYCASHEEKFDSETIVGKTVFEVLSTPSPEALAALSNAHEKNEATYFGTSPSTAVGDSVTFWTGATFPGPRTATTSQVVCIILQVTDKVAAQAELAEAIRKQDEFVARAVHELRTPITSIKTAVHMLRKASENLSGHEARELLSVLDEQSSKLKQFISELPR